LFVICAENPVILPVLWRDLESGVWGGAAAVGYGGWF
jgi:hypothetical protein